MQDKTMFSVGLSSLWSSRSASHVIHAQMEHMTATRMPNAITLATLVTPCIAVNVNQAMLAMASSVERIRTWMDGQMRTWFVLPMLLTTVKK